MSRLERDSIGEIEVEDERWYGAQTERARRNFSISGRVMPRRFLEALLALKAEAARVNGEIGVLEPRIADAIAAAAEAVLADFDEADFPVDVFQTGSGTSTNMNVNEVLANRATVALGGAIGSHDPVHPNDHVNSGQSSNDVIPTALHVAALLGIEATLRPGLELLALALERKSRELDEVVKVGRTHLQDAVPIRLGQELSGYARQVRAGLERLQTALPRLREVALGGTAVGTGLNAPEGFADAVIARLVERFGLPLVGAVNRFEALAARDAAVEVSGALRTVSVSLTKIANDLRWLSSGPRSGLGEIRLPSLQPGSSIMPGKVNPVVPEAVLMVAAQVVGNDATIAWAGAAGNFELNTMMPVIASNLLESIEILGRAAATLATRCVDGIEADEHQCAVSVERSLALVTALAPKIGYTAAAAIAREASETGRSIREVARERTELTPDELGELLDVARMTGG